MPPEWTVVLERDESDSHWIADVVALPGCVARGLTEEDATERAIALACLVLRSLTAN